MSVSTLTDRPSSPGQGTPEQPSSRAITPTLDTPPAGFLSTSRVLEAFRAAGEDTRFRILMLLREGELTITDLCRILGQSQPRVSRHIKVLIDAGLVERQREGNWVFLHLAASPGVIDAVRPGMDAVSPVEPHRTADLEALADLRNERQERAQAVFRSLAADWSRERALHVDESRIEATICQLVGRAPIRRLVDLGTGTARILELLGDRAASGLGIDANADMLNYARSRLALTGARHLRVARGDLYHLSAHRETADLVVMHQVLHFLSHPGPAIRSAATLLRPGGRLLIADFAPHTHEVLRETNGHVRLGFSDEQMLRWFAEFGLEPLERRTLAPDGAEPDKILTVAVWLAKRPDAPVSTPEPH